jgi:membrane carboxypeptidase/penicillin-binding protein
MSYVASGITGASPIWNKIMKGSLGLKDEKEGKVVQEWPQKPDEVIGASICSVSGLLPGDSGCPTRFEYFLKGTVPTETENLKKTIMINKETGQPIEPGQNIPPEKIEMQERQVVTDLTGSIFCLDCPPPSEPAIFSQADLRK